MRIIDLSKTIYEGMEVYSKDPEVKIDVVHTYENETWELREIKIGTHTGTHVDAFSHMHRGRESIDEIGLDKFLGKSKVYKKEDKFEKNIGIFFIEKVGVEILDKLIFSKPLFVGGNIDENLERELLKNSIITYTDLINLKEIPENEMFLFIGLPLKIESGDGSPIRAIAIIDL